MFCFINVATCFGAVLSYYQVKVKYVQRNLTNNFKAC